MTTTKKTSTKKAAPKAAKKTKAPAKKAADLDTTGLDRKSLAAHAKQAKKELLAIRFNIQAPSLKEYRRKRAELQKILSQLN